MRLVAFVVCLVVLAPAIGSSDSIGNVALTIVEDGTPRTLMDLPDMRIFCGNHGRCSGDGCTPVPVSTVQLVSDAEGVIITVEITDPTPAGTTLAARDSSLTATTGFANVFVRTPSAASWAVQAAGTVRVDVNNTPNSPLHIALTLTGITDGTRTLDGTIECPDTFTPTGGGGGCGDGGGGGGHDLDD